MGWKPGAISEANTRGLSHSCVCSPRALRPKTARARLRLPALIAIRITLELRAATIGLTALALRARIERPGSPAHSLSGLVVMFVGQTRGQAVSFASWPLSCRRSQGRPRSCDRAAGWTRRRNRFHGSPRKPKASVSDSPSTSTYTSACGHSA